MEKNVMTMSFEVFESFFVNLPFEKKLEVYNKHNEEFDKVTDGIVYHFDKLNYEYFERFADKALVARLIAEGRIKWTDEFISTDYDNHLFSLTKEEVEDWLDDSVEDIYPFRKELFN